LKLELAEVSRSSVTTVEDLRRKLKTTETQLQEAKDEHGQYKSRALSLFKDKAIDTNQAKIISLENQVEALKREARAAVGALEEARETLKSTEQELRATQEKLAEAEERVSPLKEKSSRTETLEREVAQLQEELEVYARTQQQGVRDFERRSKLEKQAAEEELQALRMDIETVRKLKEQENYELLFQNQVRVSFVM